MTEEEWNKTRPGAVVLGDRFLGYEAPEIGVVIRRRDVKGVYLIDRDMALFPIGGRSRPFCRYFRKPGPDDHAERWHIRKIQALVRKDEELREFLER